MKSILHQLAKYQGDQSENDLRPKAKIIVQQVRQPNDSIDLRDLALRIADPALSYTIDQEKRLSDIVVKLGSMPQSNYIDVLFSREILAIYHLYFNFQDLVTTEEHTDAFFMDFFKGKNMKEFKQKFEEAVDLTAKKIVMVRILLATFAKSEGKVTINYGRTLYTTGNTSTSCFDQPPKPQDILPKDPFRQPAADYLGIRPRVIPSSLYGPGAEGVYAGDVVKMQETLNKIASLEQLILGRLGYLMIWYAFNQTKDVLLLAPPQQLLGSS